MIPSSFKWLNSEMRLLLALRRYYSNLKIATVESAARGDGDQGNNSDN